MYLVALVFFIANFNCYAGSRIAILDFELKDLTLAPNIPAEISRTLSIKPLLERELKTANYQIIQIPISKQQYANSGVGYLFDHPETVAELGKQFGADYVLVGILHKPSYLFAYLLGNLLDTSTGKWISNSITETKGSDEKLTQKAVETLATKIDSLLDKSYSPPPPAKLNIKN